MILQVLHDGAFQLGDAFESAAPDAVSGELGKEALDHVEPRRRCRCEMQMEARVDLEPALYARSLMGDVVVDDEVKIKPFGGLLIDQPGNSRCRWRGMHVPMTLPSSMLSAANSVVVPLRL